MQLRYEPFTPGTPFHHVVRPSKIRSRPNYLRENQALDSAPSPTADKTLNSSRQKEKLGFSLCQNTW